METLTPALIKCGLGPRLAARVNVHVLKLAKDATPEQCWQQVTKKILNHRFPFAIHLLLYKAIFPHWEQLPAPAWLPDEATLKTANIAKLMHEKGFKDYSELHQWSVVHYADFWRKMTSLLNIQFETLYTDVVDLTAGIESPQWFPGAQLNITNSCFQVRKSKSTAIISQDEKGKIIKTSYEELDRLSDQVAHSLNKIVVKGDRIAIIMPMTREAIAVFLGIIKVGCVIVAIPDSFAPKEIATRLQISNAKMVFCQDQIIRNEKILPLYDKIVSANNPLTVVIPAESVFTVQLHGKDIHWNNFVSKSDEIFPAVSCNPYDHTVILFSSGTSGEPKALPWNHTTAIKCGSDAHHHHNLQPGDIFCWPTNLGWMMGPWLIFACFLNKATIALYRNVPNNKNFGLFVQDSKTTHLGVVPTMVKNWRSTACMEKLNWKSIKLFTSTGESSNVDDMLYLMSLAHYRPIIEYCGGTEIGGAYITGTVVQPASPATFTTPALGLDFVLLDENGALTDKGVAVLTPPSIGLSTEILNNNHHQIYYADMPKLADGRVARRHGDQIERFANGFYRLLGRTDDTMKLGGIKVGSAEIERVLNVLPGVYETAGVAVEPKDGGPAILIIYAVLKSKLNVDLLQIKSEMQNAIKEHLNPLFKIHDVIVVPGLPKTASNKIIRRVLREEYLKRN